MKHWDEELAKLRMRFYIRRMEVYRCMEQLGIISTEKSVLMACKTLAQTNEIMENYLGFELVTTEDGKSQWVKRS